MDNKKYSLWLKLKNTNTVLIALINAILLIVVDNYNPTSYFTQQRWMIAAAVIGAIGVVTILWIMYVTNFWKLVKLRNINAIDLILTSIVITSLGYRIYLFYAHQLHTWKFDVIRDVFGVALTFLIFREIYVHVYDKPEENKNTIDLRKLYEGKTQANAHSFVITDNPANYDLLNRDIIVSLLYDIITIVHSSNAYVIGLDGDWGTGKTTIANLTKQRLNENKNDNIKIVKGFDFWVTGSQMAILNSMYDSLLKAIGVDYSSIKMRKLLKRASNFMITIPKVGKALSKVIDENITQDDVNQLKTNLEELILSSGKKYVFFVDDLDRANKLQVLFLLKMLGTVFNLPNLVFVLLYDKNRMKKIVKDEDNLNVAFTEKIINQEIRMPEVSEEVIQDVYKKSLINLAFAYGMNNSEVKELEPAIDLVIKRIRSIRDLKRIMNSICAIAFDRNNQLDKSDTLLIEFIHFEEPSLYKLIDRNRGYFISQDFTGYAQKIIADQNNVDYDKLENFYDENLEEYNKYLMILEKIFPYVQICYGPDDPNEVINESENSKREKQHRICSGEYFDRYFSLTKINSSKIDQQIEEMIRKINSTSATKEIENNYNELLKWNYENLKLGIIKLGDHAVEISEEKCIYLFVLILNSIQMFSMAGIPSPRVLALNACSQLLKNSKLEDVSKKINQFSNRYELLGNIHILDIYVKNDNKLYKVINRFWSKMCKKVLDKNINLYNDEYYEANNAWGLYSYIEQKNLPLKKASDYLNGFISEKNVYRILFDSMIESSGSLGYGYWLDDGHYKTMGLANVSKIGDLLNKNMPTNESQRRVYDAYERYMHKNYNEKYYHDPVNPNDL